MIWNASTSCEQTASEKRSAARYRNEIIAAAALYGVLLVVSLRTVERMTIPSLRIAVALLPVLGCGAMIVALVRFAQRMDELQRKSMVEAAAISLIATSLVAMALGFLENAGVPRVGMIWVWPLAAIFWGIAFAVVRRRY
jgi:putative Mn2+ efflux pump MntP